MLIKIPSLKSYDGIWHNKISECIKKFYYLQNNVLRYAVEFKTAKKHYIYSLKLKRSRGVPQGGGGGGGIEIEQER